MKHGESDVERQISIQGIHLSAFIFGKDKDDLIFSACDTDTHRNVYLLVLTVPQRCLKYLQTHRHIIIVFKRSY